MAIDHNEYGQWCVTSGEDGNTRYEVIGTDLAFEVPKDATPEEVSAAQRSLLGISEPNPLL